jgi:hypothetical protein
MRERNVLKAAKNWIAAMADYQKAEALYQWSTGEWAEGLSTSNSFDQKVKGS